jgi:DNA-binding response OmpR family regulator
MQHNEVVSVGPIEMDSRKHWVKVCGIKRSLRPKEFILLELLLGEPETVFSKTQLAGRVWGSAYHVSDNTIEATISTLRQKLAESFEECGKDFLEDPSQAIETIRGAGYRLNGNLINEDE